MGRKIKGYYNVTNGVFLGNMTAVNEDKVMFTPRYCEGVCYGEYDMDTEEFVPETNPYYIPKGTVVTYDEDPDAFVRGKRKVNVTGFVEDTGSEIARKQVFSMAQPKRKPKPKVSDTNKRLITEVKDDNVDISKIDFGKLF